MRVIRDSFVRLRYWMEIPGENAPEWFKRSIEVSLVFGREPLPAILERAIEGKMAGELVEVELPPESAFGPHLPYLVKEIDLFTLKEPEKIRVGEWYEEVSPYGARRSFKVLEVKDGKVLVDFNHPAAGKKVLMKIEIKQVRSATPHEIMSAELRSCGGG